jgi:hypothetical protein
MVLNGFIYKGLSDMSVLYVIAPGPPPQAAAERSNQTNLHHLLVIPLVHLVIHTLHLNLHLIPDIVN